MKTAITARTLLKWGGVVAVNLMLAAVTVLAAEAYLRYRGVRPYLRTLPGPRQEGESVPWARADPALGWTIEPSYLPGQINPQGFRDMKDFERSPRPAGITRLMLLGDSFVVGAHLSSEQTLPGLLQSRLGARHEVFSAAVPGWGVDQMYLAYDRYKKVVDPDLVVLAFIDDDVKRVLEAYRSAERLTKPTLTVADGRLIPQPAVSEGRQRANRRLGGSVVASLMAREFYLTTEASDVVRQVFTSISEDMAGRGRKTIVVRIPTRDDRAPMNRLRRYLRGFESRFAGTAGVFLDAAAAITTMPGWATDLYVEDGHLNAAGTERLASVLLRHVLPAN